MEAERSRGMGIMKKLFRIDRYHKALIETELSRLGIHRSQHHVLMYLYFCPEAPTQDQIAKNMEISPAAVAVTLKKLEAAGLVERVVRRENGREKEVRLTQQGKDIADTTVGLLQRTDEMITEGFSEKDKLSRHKYENVYSEYCKRKLGIGMRNYIECEAQRELIIEGLKDADSPLEISSQE